MLLLPKLSSSFQAACSLLSDSLVCFERFAPCSEILSFLSSSLLLFLNSPNLFGNSLAPFERSAPSSEILQFLSIALLLVLNVSSLYRNSLNSLLLVLKSFSSFPAACSLASTSLVALEIL